ncbi:pyridine nucleotide-disulfide oxidoreductase domain-containing protein 1 [Panulirus ornatus]|uniref:pyridine nucleotide-disulfide oxidoreductase domain-containing protein 1 n=1 Tax=Panulirus ornatus TaxID=150431 RepID=UPI003A848636
MVYEQISEQAEIKEYTYIVIGGGIAGVTCAEHLYILQPEAEILVITATSLIKAVTNILPLTKTLDSFDVEERPAVELETQCPNVTVMKDTVIQLDAEKQCIYTSTGRSFSYERLCICTGASPKLIAENNPYVVWIRDTESARQFQSRINKAKRIIIAGNGGIATEMVHEVTGVEILWVIRDKHMTANYIDAGAAEFLRSELDKEKIESTTPVKRRRYIVDEVQDGSPLLGGALGPDWHSGLELKGSMHRKVTLESEVEISKILEPDEVKQFGKTITKLNSDEGKNKELTTMRLWTQARQMGSYAAKCMWSSLTNQEIYMDFCFELFSHATKFFGHKVILLGLFNGQGVEGRYEVLLRYTKGMEYIKCVMVDGRMQGAVLIGETDLEETFENLILNQMDLSEFGDDLLNPDVDIEDYFD